MKLPEIRIKDGDLLRSAVSVHLNELWGEGKPLLTDEEYLKYVERYNKAWKPHEKKILTGLCEVLGLEFRQNIIDVHIAPWFHAFSDPMVIGVIFKPDEFIDTLTHELSHRLLTDNTTMPYDYEIVDEWKKVFGNDHSWNTLIHIPVHALSKMIYLEVLKTPKRLERDIRLNKEYGAKDYVAAWDYVEKNDYKTIIKKLKDLYKNLPEK